MKRRTRKNPTATIRDFTEGTIVPDAVAADIASREFDKIDNGDGSYTVTLGGEHFVGPLSAASGVWSGLVGKPPVIGAGEDEAGARDAIGAVGGVTNTDGGVYASRVGDQVSVNVTGAGGLPEGFRPTEATSATAVTEVTNLASNPDLRTGYETVYTPLTATFAVGTFNLLNQGYASSLITGQRWHEERKAVAAAHVVASSVSIVGLQESESVSGTPAKSQAQDLADSINTQLSAANRWRSVDVTVARATARIIYDSTIHKQCGPASYMPGNVVNTYGRPRGIIWATFEHIASKTRFILINCHPAPNDDPDSSGAATRRAETMQIVAALATELRTSTTLPVIITADFNVTTAAVGSARQILTDAGFPDSRAVATTVTNPTLNSVNGFDATMTGRQNGDWIDGIHVTGAATTVSAARVYVAFASGGVLPLSTPLPSDHNLVTATMTISHTRWGSTSPAGSGRLTATGGARAWLSGWGNKPCVVVDNATATNYGTGVYLAAPASGAMATLGVAPGDVITIAADCIIDAALSDTGRHPSIYRCLRVAASADGPEFGMSESAPNAAGVYRLVVTLKIPAGQTVLTINAYSGHVSGVLNWANLVIAKGAYSGEYFDGAKSPDPKALTRWVGTAYQSRSVMTKPVDGVVTVNPDGTVATSSATVVANLLYTTEDDWPS